METDADQIINGFGAYTLSLMSATASGGAFSSAKIYAVQFVANQTKAYTTLQFAVTTAAGSLRITDASANGVGIYDLNGNRLALFDAQTAYASTGGKALTTGGFTLTAGRAYIMAFIFTGTGTSLALRCSPIIANINDSFAAGPYRWACKTSPSLSNALDFRSFTALSTQGIPWAALR